VRFLLLDRITDLSPPTSATGVKCVSLAEPWTLDHFPGHPVFPGALILEGMAQLGGVLLEATLRGRGHVDRHAILLAADRVRFRAAVFPGDRLEHHATLEHANEDGGRVVTESRREGAKVAEASLTFAVVPVTNPVVLARRREVLHLWLHGSTEPP
jgi:3-hydroxyacyl-[acyl-carrier-protein] dehydratase